MSGGIFTEMGKTAKNLVLGEENKNSSLSLRYQLDTPGKVVKKVIRNEIDLKAGKLDFGFTRDSSL